MNLTRNSPPTNNRTTNLFNPHHFFTAIKLTIIYKRKLGLFWLLMQQAQSTLSFAHEGGQVNSSSLRSAGEESRGCCAIVAECEIHVCGRTTPDESTEKASAGSETKTARAAAFVCCHPTPAAQSVSPGARNGCCASERRQTHAASRGGQVAFPLLLFFASRGPLSTLRLCATATGVSQRR